MDDPIAALATPYAPAALAVIRTSGKGSISLVSRLLARPERLRRAESHRVLHATLYGRSGAALDDVVLAVYRAPGGYTGEDSVELFCHGGLAGVRRILEELLGLGFRQAEPGEFTRRAFVHGKLDLTRAEAVHEVVTARTRDAHSLALGRLHGGVYERIDAAKRALVEQLARVEVQLDYPEDEVETDVSIEDIATVRAGLADLAESYESGRLYRDGVRVAIAGPTNAGKSSLFNLILRHDRAIVSPIPGTTRDYLEAEASFGGIPVRLYDTAGYRDVVEMVESEGIERSSTVSRAADLVLYVVDTAAGATAADRERIAELTRHVPCLVVWNKIDLAEGPSEGDGVKVSAETGEGLRALEEKVIEMVTPGGGLSSGDGGAALIDSLRQKALLERAVQSLRAVEEGIQSGAHLDLVAVDLKDAVDALGEITGEVTSADVLDEIFSGFCLGK